MSGLWNHPCAFPPQQQTRLSKLNNKEALLRCQTKRRLVPIIVLMPFWGAFNLVLSTWLANRCYNSCVTLETTQSSGNYNSISLFPVYRKHTCHACMYAYGLNRIEKWLKSRLAVMKVTKMSFSSRLSSHNGWKKLHMKFTMDFDKTLQGIELLLCWELHVSTSQVQSDVTHCVCVCCCYCRLFTGWDSNKIMLMYANLFFLPAVGTASRQ